MRGIWRNFDFLLLAATMLLICLGVAMIHSASLAFTENYALRQAIYALGGFGLMLLVAAVDYRFLGSLYRFAYASAILLLAVVLLWGRLSYGAQRWIGLRFLPFQPAELTKVLVIIALAKYLADNEGEIHRLRHVLISLASVALPMLLIYSQPDLGTALVLGAIWLSMALMAGMRLLHLILLGLSSGLAMPLIWSTLEAYMRERIIVFLDPQSDPLGAAYNVNQARIAVGSGGWLGQGFASGPQSQLCFLRVRHTDFIFSVLAEELGFVGALLLFSLLVIVLLRIVRAASLARDTFGRLIACGVAAVVLFQGFVNVAVNMGLLPMTGIPLPLISYGGSSLVTLLAAEGLVQSIVMRHKKIEF